MRVLASSSSVYRSLGTVPCLHDDLVGETVYRTSTLRHLTGGTWYCLDVGDSGDSVACSTKTKPMVASCLDVLGLWSCG